MIFVCFFVWSFSSHSRILHLYGDVTLTGEPCRAAHFDQYFALMATEQWGFFKVPGACTPFAIWDIRSWWSSPRTLDIYTCCRLFGSAHGTVTTCINDLCLFRQGIEPRSPAFVANALPLTHRWDLIHVSRLLLYMLHIICDARYTYVVMHVTCTPRYMLHI